MDSITPTFNTSQSKIAINVLRALGAKVKNSGGVFIMTATTGSISEEVKSNIEAMVDSVIQLSIQNRGGSTRRILRVKKVSGHRISSEPTEFEIVSHKGIIFRKKRVKLQAFHWKRSASSMSTS